MILKKIKWMPWKALKLTLGRKIHEEHVGTNMVKCLTVLEDMKHGQR